MSGKSHIREFDYRRPVGTLEFIISKKSLVFLKAFNYRIYLRISPPTYELKPHFWSQKSVI